MKNGTLKPDILAERTASSSFKCVAFQDVGVNEHCLFRLGDWQLKLELADSYTM